MLVAVLPLVNLCSLRSMEYVVYGCGILVFAFFFVYMSASICMF